MRACTRIGFCIGFSFWLSLSFGHSQTWLQTPQGPRPILESEQAGVVRLDFPRLNLSTESWLVLGPLTLKTPLQIEIQGSGPPRVYSVPALKNRPGWYALQVPPGLRHLSYTRPGFQHPEQLFVFPKLPNSESLQPLIAISRQSTELWLPPWKTAPGFSPLLSLSGLPRGLWNATFRKGTRQITIQTEPVTGSLTFLPVLQDLQPQVIQLTPAQYQLQEISLTGIADPCPLPADAQTLLTTPASRWRNAQREWFSWTELPGIMVLVSSTYAIQDRFLKRLAFFVEKTGFRGRLSTDSAMAGIHGWNAHDYAPADLARFFSLAAQSQFALNPEEYELQRQLEQAGVLIQKAPGRWEPGTGALLGISLESPPALREFLFTHEAFHGLYFTSPAFQQRVHQIWNELPEQARSTFRSFLAHSRYDPSDEGLMINEFQAYVLQQPSTGWPSFFQTRVLKGAALSLAESAQILGDFLNAAEALNTSVEVYFQHRSGQVMWSTRLP